MRPSDPRRLQPVAERGMTNPLRGFLRLMAGPLACLCLLMPATAQAGGLTMTRHGDWTLLQGADGLCQLRYSMHSARSGAVLLEMILRAPDPDATGAEGEGAMVAVLVPRGASLRDTVAYRHPRQPDRAIGLAWQSCNVELCLAAGQISPEELDRLRRGNHVEVAFRPLPDAVPIRMQVSLRGVTAGWRALAACRNDATTP